MRGGMRRVTRRAALCVLALLTGCAGLPEAGPGTKAIATGGAAAGYRLVPLTGTVAEALAPAAEADDAENTFAALPPGAPSGLIAPGDALQITLWEASPTGATLLTPPGLQTILRVDGSGAVLLPYIGQLHAAGETPLALQRRIMGIFQGQGHAIQAAVLDAQGSADSVILAGGAVRPGAYPLTAGADSLLAVIALGGGARDAEDETLVRLRRGGVSAAAPLAAVTADPALDVPLASGDIITLLPRRRAYYAFGAVNHPGMFAYGQPVVTLIQALAESAGLQDERAAPRGVFIYRPGPDEIVYQLDLSQPQGFFVASQFALRPDDVIYVSDAPVADVAKLLQTITGMGSVAAVPRDFGAPY